MKILLFLLLGITPITAGPGFSHSYQQSLFKGQTPLAARNIVRETRAVVRLLHFFPIILADFKWRISDF